MKKSFTMLFFTLLLLAFLDVGVAGILVWADAHGKLGSLVRYFEYGRSVPGKLAQWEIKPDMPGNLYDIAWRSGMVSASSAKFAKDHTTSGPIVRSYGMSFVNHILESAQEVEPELKVDRHGGPGAPPNYTYALFLDDAQSRQPGDVVVFGILSSAIPALAALSSRTWAFEQPAPFTYPIFWPVGDSFRRIEPLVDSAMAERALRKQSVARAAWARQLTEEDFFYSPIEFSATWLDYSPLARLGRRSLAKSHIERTKEKILSGSYPYVEVLQKMIATFAETARREGQVPIVMLIQSQRPGDADVMDIAKPVLERDDIPFFATAEHFDPQNPSGFLGDGHYKPEINKRFGEAFLDLLNTLNAPAQH